MTEDSGARVSADVSNDASQTTRQRKKRKWDQPAESLDNYPLGNMGSLVGISLPGVVPPLSAGGGGFLTNPLAASCAGIPPAPIQGSSVPKLIQPKIQDELVIAREIVINDAESSLRYKLTKRQTQEEIQKCTGAVVITRGKYRPPNAPPDGERPLYLHISAAAHLKETAERIIAVDRAAAMVEEMLKQGQNSQTSFVPLQTVVSNGMKAISACVYLGFDADPSLNIASRIRGPNDQYINHIMNETGATVRLKGHRSGTNEGPQGEEVQQPLHLFLSSNNPKSMEDAKRLAEHLLDTIAIECGATRAPSCKVYNAVPPPQHLLTGVQSPVHVGMAAGLTSSMSITSAPPVPSVMAAGIATVYSQTALTQSGGTLNCIQPQPNMGGYSQSKLTGGTSYNGYEGIYPQATPLQQVALALRQSTSPITSAVGPTTSVASTTTKSNVICSLEKEKRPPQKRKFQELPVGSKVPAKINQGTELPNSSELSASLDVRNVSNMPAPKKLVQKLADGMPTPPPSMMPPPPAPKFTSLSPTTSSHEKKNSLIKTKPDNVPDTLVKLMEYGDDDDDDDEDDDTKKTSEELLPSDSSFDTNSSNVAVRKPFWAL